MGTGPTTSHRIVARLMVVGDSTACTMLAGLEAVGAPKGVQVEDAAVIGCGVVSGRIAPFFRNGQDVSSGSRFCQSRANAVEARTLRLGRPTVVLWVSSWEKESLAVGSGPDPKILVQGSPQWNAVLLQRMEQRVSQFTATGATVVMLTQPPFVDFGNPTSPRPLDTDFERLNTLLSQFALHRSHVVLIDLAARVCPSGPPCPLVVDNVDVRSDGAHYSAEGSLWVARWLMPQLGITALRQSASPLPVMKVAVPFDGTVVKGLQQLDATGPFHIGVSRVEFQVTGGALHNVVIGTATITRYGWLLLWNSTSVPNGTYAVRSVAYGSGAERTISPSITIMVAN